MKESIDNLLRQLHSPMAAYSIPPTKFGDGNPRPSTRGQQRNPSIPPYSIKKQSASTPRTDKGKGVDRGDGNNPNPPPLPRNTGGDPNPENDHDPNDDNDGEDNRGRKGGRPARASRRPSIP